MSVIGIDGLSVSDVAKLKELLRKFGNENFKPKGVYTKGQIRQKI